MKIYIIDKNEVRDLEIIDPNTGIEWTGDMLGNYGFCGWDKERELLTMDASEFEWWEAFICEKERADFRAKEVESSLSGERLEQFRAALCQAAYKDLEGEPGFINSVCDEFIDN